MIISSRSSRSVKLRRGSSSPRAYSSTHRRVRPQIAGQRGTMSLLFPLCRFFSVKTDVYLFAISCTPTTKPQQYYGVYIPLTTQSDYGPARHSLRNKTQMVLSHDNSVIVSNSVPHVTSAIQPSMKFVNQKTSSPNFPLR